MVAIITGRGPRYTQSLHCACTAARAPLWSPVLSKSFASQGSCCWSPGYPNERRGHHPALPWTGDPHGP